MMSKQSRRGTGSSFINISKKESGGGGHKSSWSRSPKRGKQDKLEEYLDQFYNSK